MLLGLAALAQPAQFPTSVGHCGETVVANNEQPCRSTGRHGAWDATKIAVSSLEACAMYCLAHCPRCRFVSFSANSKDCSWYHSCPRKHMRYGGEAYLSRQVRDVALEDAPPPPPPPAWDAPSSAVPGYCALMGPALGDCSGSDQGSWPGVDSPSACLARCRNCERCAAVSFTLAAATEAAVPRETTQHPPHWWRCRWYVSLMASQMTTDDLGWPLMPSDCH